MSDGSKHQLHTRRKPYRKIVAQYMKCKFDTYDRYAIDWVNSYYIVIHLSYIRYLCDMFSNIVLLYTI